MFRVDLKTAATLAALSFLPVPAQAVEVYMFKGAGDFSFVNENMHFSRGLSKMADVLNSEGIHTEVRRFGSVEDALATIRQRKPKTIAFVGHSMGALASMAMARNLKGEGVEIVYMALLDIPGPVGVAGQNVAWVENYYTINPVYGRLTNVASHPNAKNIHVSGYIHNRLDDAPKVQNGVLAAIRKIHALENQDGAPQPETLMVERTVPANSLDRPIQREVVEYTPSQPIEANVDAWASYRVPTAQSGAVSSNVTAYQAPIDPVTTASVSPQASVIDTGKDLIRKVGGFLTNPDRKRGRYKQHTSPDR